jgi:hypothetical protein
MKGTFTAPPTVGIVPTHTPEHATTTRLHLDGYTALLRFPSFISSRAPGEGARG